MDVARAGDQIDALIAKRAGQGSAANAEEELWKASARKHNEKLRRRHRAEWFCYFSRLADSLRASAEHWVEPAIIDKLLLLGRGPRSPSPRSSATAAGT